MRLGQHCSSLLSTVTTPSVIWFGLTVVVPAEWAHGQNKKLLRMVEGDQDGPSAVDLVEDLGHLLTTFSMEHKVRP